ncbi:2-aminoadipate transaminase [Aureococcus anophagefferens]|uniref:2-aminoadipate transaminase n=1 Tax=Aureococcus anophagefferens TaxID=44056 RepID=A0ABR1FWN3_AURAN
MRALRRSAAPRPAPRPAPRRFAAAAPRAMIDLRKGHPRLEELPHGAVSRACAAAAADLAARGEAGLPLNYGPARGQRSHLAALAGWLARALYGSLRRRSVAAHDDERRVARPRALRGGAHAARRRDPRRGPDLLPRRGHLPRPRPDDPLAPSTRGGRDADALERALRAGDARPARGAARAPARGAGAPRGRVVSVGSFTKILSPGLRASGGSRPRRTSSPASPR